MEIIELSIFLFAIFGIFATIAIFLDSYRYNNIISRTYEINGKNYINDAQVEIIIKVNNLSSKDVQEKIKKIETGNYKDIYEVADYIRILKK